MNCAGENRFYVPSIRFPGERVWYYRDDIRDIIPEPLPVTSSSRHLKMMGLGTVAIEIDLSDVAAGAKERGKWKWRPRRRQGGDIHIALTLLLKRTKIFV
ncbi:hypothetical protein DPEC_G00296020 [Dallia pectoralis]|uniref:Uncharacterized protein n=1 Tax=Dallia pectoralis TaxID=75939 RepID=A0ACC2FIX3_DALPE|nr:hypothetical protein DPEC_G00296020 [Dallia pectoralis]